jgi:hypothetical protein
VCIEEGEDALWELLRKKLPRSLLRNKHHRYGGTIRCFAENVATAIRTPPHSA